MGDDPTNVLEISSDASSCTEIQNPKMTNVTSLVVNRSIAKLTMLSDSSYFSASCIQNGSEPLSFYLDGNTKGYVGLVIRDTNIDHSSLELVEAHWDEIITLLFINFLEL